MAGLIHDIAAMAFADWLRLAAQLCLLAVTYALGMEAGYAKAARNGGVGWFGFAFLALFIIVYTVATHAGRPVPPWWSSIPGYSD